MENIVEMLIRHEGLKLKPYKDSLGNLTIGVGRNLEEGISKEEAVMLLKNDIQRAISDVKGVFKGFDTFTSVRRNALINMCFNLGKTRFMKFKKMTKAIEEGNWDLASAEALDSRWAKQVGERAIEISEELK